MKYIVVLNCFVHKLLKSTTITDIIAYDELIYICLFTVGNDMNIVGLWKVIDQIVQQVVLQQKNGKNPDVEPVEMNVKNLIRQ